MKLLIMSNKLQKPLTEHKKGVLALVILAVIYGLLPLIPRYLSTSLDLFQQVYLRMFFAFVLSYVFFHKSIDLKKISKAPLREWGIIASRSLIYYLFGVVLYTQALLLTKISNVAFIGAIPMTAILGFVLLKEKLTFKKLAFVTLSFVGVLLISVKSVSGTLTFGVGEMIALISVFFISLGLISRKWQSDFFNDKEISTFMLFFAFIFVFIASLLKGEGLPSMGGLSMGILLALMLGGILNAGLSFLMNYGFSKVNVVLANNIVALEPVFATFFAFIVFQEIPLPKEVVGGVIVVLSAFLMHRLKSESQ